MAFITGSLAYGEPNEESDVDLVILLDSDSGLEDEEYLKHFSDAKPPQIRFGKLNLIVCYTETEYAYWKAATEMMRREKKEGKPSNKKKAKQRLDWFREKLGLFDRGDSKT